MCDKQSASDCHRIFSEKAEGWSTGEVTVNRRDPVSGRVRPYTDNIDMCPACTGHTPTVGPLPLAIQAYQPPAQPVPDDAVTEVKTDA